MAQIRRLDVAEKDLFHDISLSAEKAKTDLVELSNELQKTLEIQLKIAQGSKKGAAGYKELAGAVNKSKTALSEKSKIDKRILTLQQKLTSVTKLQKEREASLSVEMQRRNKITKQQAILTNQNIGAFEKLNIKIKQTSDRYRNLLVQEGKETRQTKLLKAEILALNKVRDTANQNLGMHQNKVGQYGNAINKLRGGLAQLGLAFGVFSVLRNTFGIISDNEEAMASLSAITGLTGEKFDQFKNKVGEVAAELKVSSTDTAKAFELIASAQPALLKDADALGAVTKQAIILNQAIKGDLSETSLALVGVMNQFNLKAEESARIINVLAAGSQAGAATVTQINEAMVKFGTTANLLNISVEESVGLIETLGEKAIFGAEAGTALKNIMLIMSSIDVLPPKALAQLDKYGVDTSIVTDKTLTFSDRMKELGKIGGDTTAIMQVFGKENATAATVLLNSTDTIDSMTAAVTGSNVATEQAAVNQNTITATVDRLKAAWENWVLEMDKGVGVGAFVKDLLNFLAENLASIIEFVVKGAKAWILYKSALTLVNNQGTGAIQMFKNLKSGAAGAQFSIETLAKGLLGMVGIVTVLLPIFIDLVKGIGEMVNRTTALDKVTDKYNERMIEEQSKMDLLRVEVQGAIGDKEKMEELINRINANYGTTLQNLDDEAAMLRQLEEAYRAVNAEMEKKIMKQLIEEELVELFKEKRAIEKELEKGLGGIVEDAFESRKEDVIADINELQAELLSLNEQALSNQGKNRGSSLVNRTREELEVIETGGSSGSFDAEKAKLDRLAALRKAHNDELLALENELLKSGVDRELIDFELSQKRIELFRKEGDLIVELDFKDKEILIKHDNDYLKFLEANGIQKVAQNRQINEEVLDDDIKARRLRAENHQKHLDLMAEREREMWGKIRELVVDSFKLFEKLGENNIALLDKQSEKEEQKFGDSKERENELKELAKEKGLDATESIKVEREEQRRALEAQRIIAEKKAKIEALLVGLRLLAAKVEQGQGNPVANIKADILDVKSFIEGAFYKGTDYTVADALGYSPGRDSHVVAVDNNEVILNPEQTKALGIGKGKRSTQEAVDLFKSGMLSKTMRPNFDPTALNSPMKNDKLLQKLEAIENNTKPVSVQDRTTFNAITGVLEYYHKSNKGTNRVKYKVRK